MERQTIRPRPSPIPPSIASTHDHHLEQLLRQWRNLRQSLNQHLTASLIQSLSGQQARISGARTRPLCQLLIDYLFIGHFAIYPGLARNSARLGVEERRVARGNYHNITTSTDQALQFNDRYGQGEDGTGAPIKDISKLNQALLVRYVLEEQLTDLLR